jgi:hypothetical protein
MGSKMLGQIARPGLGSPKTTFNGPSLPAVRWLDGLYGLLARPGLDLIFHYWAFLGPAPSNTWPGIEGSTSGSFPPRNQLGLLWMLSSWAVRSLLQLYSSKQVIYQCFTKHFMWMYESMIKVALHFNCACMQIGVDHLDVIEYVISSTWHAA